MSRGSWRSVGLQRNVEVIGGISTGKSERTEVRDKGPGSLTQKI